ncbi:MFS transporter [Leifsonia sp. Root112D2]|uniref:MFS transporter n=1 Tax=Leifsonia sp. Root112D2 TaxID=1736426 RepID=UPI000A818D3A|nr:MFS transporter [Leifsonia sp. Root112D2]
MSTSLSASTRWWALGVLSLTQLVVVLDGTIVSIALPQAQQQLGLSDSGRQWVVTAYALAFGALLLLGGRIADYWGRKRTFLVGMLGFGAASVFGGVAQSGIELIIARGLQGLFAAMLAPAALALLTVSFPHGKDRNTAFAVFGTVAGAGAAVGLLLGGVLTEFADWRWCLLVNVFFVIVGFVGALLFVAESKADGNNRYDVLGAITVSLGLGALVYGFSLAESGWGEPLTIGFLALGVVLLALFVFIESRVAQPLLPLRIVVDKVRGGAFLIQAVAGSVMIGATLYLTFHLQIVLGMPPLESGLASLPLTIAIMIAAPVVTRLLPVIGPRPLLIAGPLIVAVGLIYLSRITADGSYFVQVLPALIVMGIGMGAIFVPVQNLALTGVASHDAGAASATVNAAMQIGGSVGLSIFTAVYAASVGAPDALGGASRLTAFATGYSATFLAAAVAMALASIVAIFLVRGPKSSLLPQGDLPVLAHAG